MITCFRSCSLSESEASWFVITTPDTPIIDPQPIVSQHAPNRTVRHEVLTTYPSAIAEYFASHPKTHTPSALANPITSDTPDQSTSGPTPSHGDTVPTQRIRLADLHSILSSIENQLTVQTATTSRMEARQIAMESTLSVLESKLAVLERNRLTVRPVRVPTPLVQSSSLFQSPEHSPAHKKATAASPGSLGPPLTNHVCPPMTTDS
jgi:hypothetical protein